MEVVASADGPVLDAVMVESEVSSDKADTEDVTSFMSPVGEAPPADAAAAAAVDALATSVAVETTRAEATVPASVPASEEVEVEVG